MTLAVDFQGVDILFGRNTLEALKLLDGGATRSDILQNSGVVVGCAGANLQVHEGEISVLMGLSGSGKSTLLRAVNRLNKVTRGKILVRNGADMVDVVSCNETTLRHLRQNAVAMVFQQFALLPWQTVRENIGFGLDLAGIPTLEKEARVNRQLELVGLSQWADKYAHELSGGMQQRVGLARAFATEAPILLMDEPFSALDPLIRTKLQDELLLLQKTLKKTIIFVSHDLEEALKIGNHISIMESGRIVQTGRPEEIILRPANAYVRDFIANVNPLSVLTAWNVMRNRHVLEKGPEGWLWLDRRCTVRVKLGADGKVISAERGGQAAAWVSCVTPPHEGPAPLTALYWAKPETPLKDVMIAMQRAYISPIALFDDEGRFEGVIGMRDVLRALVRRSDEPALASA